MFSFTSEQILVVSVLSVWFLFPLGMLVSFIRQSNEAHSPRVINQPLANDIAHSAAYAPNVDGEEDFEPTTTEAYKIPKGERNSDNYRPGV